MNGNGNGNSNSGATSVFNNTSMGSQTGSESTTYTDGWTATDYWILGYWVVFGLTIILVLLQCIGLLYNATRLRAENRTSYASGQGSSTRILLTLFVTYFCCVLGIGLGLARMHQWPNAASCKSALAIGYIVYVTMKAANYFFFLQRAKLAQGLTKVIDEKHFDKTIPICIIVAYIIQVAFILLSRVEGEAVTSDRSGDKYCLLNSDTVTELVIAAFIIQAVYDMAISAFFLYLFGSPLFALSKKKMSGSSRNDMTDKKLLRTVYINFVFTTMSSVDTALVSTLLFSGFFQYWALIDYFINAFCMFCMFASNRRLLLHMVCPLDVRQTAICCCWEPYPDMNDLNEEFGSIMHANGINLSPQSGKYQNNSQRPSKIRNNKNNTKGTKYYDKAGTSGENNSPKTGPTQLQSIFSGSGSGSGSNALNNGLCLEPAIFSASNEKHNEDTNERDRDSPATSTRARGSGAADSGGSGGSGGSHSTTAKHVHAAMRQQLQAQGSELTLTITTSDEHDNKVASKMGSTNSSKHTKVGSASPGVHSVGTQIGTNSSGNYSPEISPQNRYPSFGASTEDGGSQMTQMTRTKSSQEKAKERQEEIQASMINFLTKGCWYYKFKLFWTWVGWMFCCPKCWIFVCSGRSNANRVTDKERQFKELFCAAEQIQLRHYQAKSYMYENSKLHSIHQNDGDEHSRHGSRASNLFTNIMKRSSPMTNGNSNNNNNNNNNNNEDRENTATDSSHHNNNNNHKKRNASNNEYSTSTTMSMQQHKQHRGGTGAAGPAGAASNELDVVVENFMENGNTSDNDDTNGDGDKSDNEQLSD